MTKPTISLQDLRAKIGQRAKSAPAHRFWGLHVHLVKLATLEAAYLEAKRNGGAPGTDAETFEMIEARGRHEFLRELDFSDSSYGARAGRSAHEAIEKVRFGLLQRKHRVVDIDLSRYFDDIRHDRVLAKVARRIVDGDVLAMVKAVPQEHVRPRNPARISAVAASRKPRVERPRSHSGSRQRLHHLAAPYRTRISDRGVV